MIEIITELIDGTRYKLDVNQNVAIAISKSFLDLQDFTKRKSDYTKSFDLPGTDTNKYFFGLFGDFGTLGAFWTPRVLTKAWILEDTNIIIEGQIKLESTDPKADIYTVSITGNIYTIKDALGEKLLSDLDMSDWLYSSTDIRTSWNGSLWSGHMIFPVHDFGFGFGLYKKKDTGNVLIDITDSICANTIILDRTLPAFRLNELLRKMISESGYDYEGSWFSEDEVEKIYVQSDNPRSQFFDESRTMLTKLTVGLPLLTTYQVLPLVGNPSIADWSDSTHQYTAPIAGVYYFDWAVSIRPGNPSTSTITLEFQKNGVTSTTRIWAWSTGNSGTLNVTLAAGDTYRMRIKVSSFTTVGEVNVTGTYLRLLSVVGSAATVDPSEHLANYRQIDFLREIIGIFNLILWQPDSLTIRLDTYDYYMANYGEFKDWTNKLDVSKKPIIMPINSELSNPINLEMKRADDVLNKEYIRVSGRSYGSYLEDTRIPYALPPQEPFKVFAPMPVQEVTSDVSAAENLEILVAKYYPSVDDLTYTPPGLQLAYYNGARTLTAGHTLYFKYVPTSICVSASVYPYFSPFRLYSADSWEVQEDTLDLNFTWFTPPADIVYLPAKENLYKRYFREMLRERYDEVNKILILQFVLDPVDIANFSFADKILVSINGTPMTIRILEIYDYAPNIKKSTKVKAMISLI